MLADDVDAAGAAGDKGRGPAVEFGEALGKLGPSCLLRFERVVWVDGGDVFGYWDGVIHYYYFLYFSSSFSWYCMFIL